MHNAFKLLVLLNFKTLVCHLCTNLLKNVIAAILPLQMEDFLDRQKKIMLIIDSIGVTTLAYLKYYLPKKYF
jgi:hypothetical protein